MSPSSTYRFKTARSRLQIGIILKLLETQCPSTDLVREALGLKTSYSARCYMEHLSKQGKVHERLMGRGQGAKRLWCAGPDPDAGQACRLCGAVPGQAPHDHVLPSLPRGTTLDQLGHYVVLLERMVKAKKALAALGPVSMPL